MVNLIRLRGEGFLSYKELELPLAAPGLYLVHGQNHDAFESNGAGKSAAFELLVWTLWGTTIRGLTGDAVVNRRAKTGALGLLDLEVNGRSLLLERRRKRPDTEDGLDIFVRDGKRLKHLSKEWSSTQAQQYVARLLQMDESVFVNTVFFGQGTRTRAFADATDADQKRILTGLLGIEVWKRAQELAREALKGLSEKQLQDTARLGELQAKESTFDYMVSDEERAAAKWGGCHEIEIDEAKARVDNAAGELAIAKQHQHNAARAVNTATGLEGADGGEANAEYNRLLMDAQKLDEQWGRLEGQKGQLMDDALAQTKLGENVSTMVGSRCPTCARPVRAADVSAIGKYSRNRARGHNQKAGALEKEQDALLDEANGYRNEARKHKDKMLAARDLRQKLAIARERAENAASGAKVASQRKRDAEDALGRLRKTENPHHGAAERLTGELRAARREISAVVAQMKRRETLIGPLRWWEHGFGNAGIPAHLINRAVPVLNEAVARYADMFTDGTVNIAFRGQTTLKEGDKRVKFNVAVDNRAGAKAYRGNSGGEKRRVDLCVQFALQELVALRAGSDLNIRIFDEPFDALDAEGVERVVMLLKGLAERGLGVYVITQDASLRTFFDRVMVAEKRDGLSILRTEGAHG